jgi:hypothetical protein
MIYYRYRTNFDNIFFSMATKMIREDSNQAGFVLISNWPLGNRIRICNVIHDYGSADLSP